MGINEATIAFRDLAASTEQYDSGKDREYCRLMDVYLKKSRAYKTAIGQLSGTPFVDVTKEMLSALPEPLRSECDDWLTQKKIMGAEANVCRWYLKFKIIEDSLSEEQKMIMNIYDPLILLIKQGGYFYDHHGAVGVGERALKWYEPPGA